MSDASADILELPSRLDVPAAEALLAELLERRGTQENLVIDGSAVGMIDTPAIQILLSAAADQKAREADFSVINPSDAITEAMSLMGLAEELETWRGSDE